MTRPMRFPGDESAPAAPPQSRGLRGLGTLAPVAQALDGLLAPVQRVAPRSVRVSEALGRVLADPLRAGAPVPRQPIALRDGWAVCASDVVGASSYSPVVAARAPAWVGTGMALPAETDAVVPPDGVSLDHGMAVIVTAAAPGEGVRRAGADAAAGAILRPAGERLRVSDLAVAQAAGVAQVAIREARLRVIALPEPGTTPPESGTNLPQSGTNLPQTATNLPQTATNLPQTGSSPAGELVARFGEAAGATVQRVGLRARDGASIAAALGDPGCDMIVVVGGTGCGRDDHAAQALAQAGSLLGHGLALRPGETGGCGLVVTTPVVLVPDRLEAALAVTLVIVLPCLDHLMAATPRRPVLSGRLTRKIPSTVGLTELVFLRGTGGALEPLAVADVTLAALAGADAWLAVPPDSEGFAADELVAAYML